MGPGSGLTKSDRNRSIKSPRPPPLQKGGTKQGKGGGQSPEMLLLSGNLAASMDFSRLPKIHQSCCAGPPSLCGGKLGHQHMKDPHGNNLQCGVQTLCHGGWRGAPQLYRSANSGVFLNSPGLQSVKAAMPSPCLGADHPLHHWHLLIC